MSMEIEPVEPAEVFFQQFAACLTWQKQQRNHWTGGGDKPK